MAGGLWSIGEAIANFVVPYSVLHQIDNVLNLFRSSRLYAFKHPDQENWALVTGASDGIGEAIAHELAARGFNVILHGRNPEKLKKKEALLKEAYSDVKTKIWVADATQSLSREQIIEVVQGLHLTLLVNNVGGLPSDGPDGFLLLEDHPFEHIDRIIHMNAAFTTKLESALLPTLIANEPSGILNISSLGSMGTPYLSVYNATKGYLNSHSISLQAELTGRKKDVTVHSILVGQVKTNSSHARPGFASPSSRVMAKSILDNVGLGRCIMAPYLPHLLQSILIGILPETVTLKLKWDAIVAVRQVAAEEKAKLS